MLFPEEINFFIQIKLPLCLCACSCMPYVYVLCVYVRLYVCLSALCVLTHVYVYANVNVYVDVCKCVEARVQFQFQILSPGMPLTLFEAESLILPVRQSDWAVSFRDSSASTFQALGLQVYVTSYGLLKAFFNKIGGNSNWCDSVIQYSEIWALCICQGTRVSK